MAWYASSLMTETAMQFAYMAERLTREPRAKTKSPSPPNRGLWVSPCYFAAAV